MQYVIQHKEYFPATLVYGFIGKHPNINKHNYREHKEAVKNRETILKFLDSEHSHIILPKQVHGINCANIKTIEHIDYTKEGDAQITNNKKFLIGVQTADCTPILLFDPTEKIVGIAHAGWRGAVDGVIDSTLKEMKKAGATLCTTVAIIGPCIRQNSYEVSQDFTDRFLLEDMDNSKFFKKSPIAKGKFLFDLPGYVTHALIQAQIKKIYDTKIDTFADSNFFSYRKACLDGKKLDGHNLSFIGLR